MLQVTCMARRPAAVNHKAVVGLCSNSTKTARRLCFTRLPAGMTATGRAEASFGTGRATFTGPPGAADLPMGELYSNWIQLAKRLCYTVSPRERMADGRAEHWCATARATCTAKRRLEGMSVLLPAKVEDRTTAVAWYSRWKPAAKKASSIRLKGGTTKACPMGVCCETALAISTAPRVIPSEGAPHLAAARCSNWPRTVPSPCCTASRFRAATSLLPV